MIIRLRNFIFRTLLKLLFKRKATIAESRANSERSAKWMGELPEGILVEKTGIDGFNAEWIYTVNTDEEKVVLYLHGGGYITGSANTHRMLCASLAQSANAKVLLLEYRLAPENPFPAALEDAISAYLWLLAQGFEASNIIISGDSAGGGLSLATVQKLRDDDLPLPAGVICISPWTDLTMSYETHRSKAKTEPILRADNLHLWAYSYVGDANPHNPLISPAFADFNGFPPLFIQVGSEEVLLDDALQVAEKAKSAGVDVTLKIWQGMWHVWHATGSFLPETSAAFEEIGEFVRDIWRK